MDGRTFNGQWKDGLMEGYGVMTWPEGKIYKGYYKDNNRHG